MDQGAPIGIICGGGSLPIAVADAAIRRGRRVMLFPIECWADPQAMAGYPHRWVALGQLGRMCRLARAAGCRELVFIGTVLRPAIRQIRFDWMTLRILPDLLRAFRGGDDHLLSGIAKIFEKQGFRMIGAHELAPEILVPEGVLGKIAPKAAHQADIALGLSLLAATGPFDVGQAVVVANGHVLAIEAAEGTDRMLTRVADLRAEGRIRLPAGSGVLVKAPKRGQDRRFDLPTIGPQTIEGARQAGLAGVAVAAGGTLVAEPSHVAQLADRAGLFVVGVAQAGALS